MSDGLFDDLEALPHVQINEMSKQLERDLRSLDDEFNSLKQERRSQVEIVKSLRSAVGGIEEADGERRNLLREFHEIKKKADKERELRDRVNISIPPPASVLEEWMADTYSKLTTIDNDLTAVPTINRELESFRRFFELQAAVVRKREAEQAHTRYVTQIEKLRKVTTDLDSTKKTKQNAEESVTDGTELDSNKITRKEIRRMSKEISGIDKRLDAIKSERRKLRKESGRIRSYLKITSQQGKKIRLTDVKNRASTGGALNTNELSALLESGGLTEITENSNKSNDENNSSPKRARGRKKGMRKLGVTRGGPRKGNSATRRE